MNSDTQNKHLRKKRMFSD